MNRILARQALDAMCSTGHGESLWLEHDDDGWHVVVEVNRTDLPDPAIGYVQPHNIKVKFLSNQPAIPASVVQR